MASYFDAQAARFAEVPRGVLAHSALVKGEGSYAGGVERPRIEVVLATARIHDDMDTQDDYEREQLHFRGRSEG